MSRRICRQRIHVEQRILDSTPHCAAKAWRKKLIPDGRSLIARIMAEGVRDIFSLLHATIRKHGHPRRASASTNAKRMGRGR
jgi:hypothetical protein